MTRQTTLISTLLTLALAPAAFAQEPTAPQSQQSPQAPLVNEAEQRMADMRAVEAQLRQIRMFEGALQTGVRQGGQTLVRQHAPELPNSIQLTANLPQAKGFAPPLGGGLYFYVSIPNIRMMVTDMLNQFQPAAEQPMRPAGRTTRPAPQVNAASGLAGAQVAPPDPMLAAPETAGSPVADDGRCALRAKPSGRAPIVNYWYAISVCDALMDAMLDYSGALSIKENESLTIMMVPEDDEPGIISTTSGDVTYLWIKGSDLLAYRKGELSRDDARKRIEMKR